MDANTNINSQPTQHHPENPGQCSQPIQCQGVQSSQWDDHLDWSSKQSRVLTDNGNALTYYSAQNGFPFSNEELPHYHFERGDSHEVFRQWAKDVKNQNEQQKSNQNQRQNQNQKQCSQSGQNCCQGCIPNPIVGVWKRTLFSGKWEHSTDHDEVVYNVQTGTLFVDLRIPRSKPSQWEKLKEISGKQLGEQGAIPKSCREILERMSDFELQLYARQHAFGGFSCISSNTANGPNESNDNHSSSQLRSLPFCTRHHCIDWNFIQGKPRPRPNKWYIDPKYPNHPADQPHSTNSIQNGGTFNTWKEWSYATDNLGQCYYWERWERLPGDEMGLGLCLALRKRPRPSQPGNETYSVDGIVVAVGVSIMADHFNYIFGRRWNGTEKQHPHANNVSNLVELVDHALQHKDRSTAISYLTLDAGHGTISSGWRIDRAIQSWKQGVCLLDDIVVQHSDNGGCSGSGGGKIKVRGDGSNYFQWDVIVGGSVWDVYECSIADPLELESLLKKGVETTKSKL